MGKLSEVEWDGRRGGDKGACTENVIYLSCTQHVDILSKAQHRDTVSLCWPGRDCCTPFLPRQRSLENRYIHKESFSTLGHWTVGIFNVAFYKLLPDAYPRAVSLTFPCFLHKGCERNKNLHTSYLNRSVMTMLFFGCFIQFRTRQQILSPVGVTAETSFTIPVLDPPWEICNHVR